MVPWGTFLRLLGGRALAERSEQKRMEREYKDAEAALKLITEVANEPRIEHPSRPPSSASSIPERRQPVLGAVRPPQRPIYERCTSSPAVPTVTTHKTPAGPPDITARDLSTEELKRNYSCDNVWHFKDQPLPPMPQMTGFGRYRRAVNAPAQWQLEHLHQSMHEIGAVIVSHLGECPPAGLDPETWREYRAHHSRANSSGSSRSSSSGPGVTAAMEYLDTITGTRVSRGFCPSNPSSAASSLRDGSGHYRRDSTMSKASMTMTSPGSDADARHSCLSSRISPYRHTSVTSMSPLTAISETQEAHNGAVRKIERPCEFHDGANSENAVASDDDELDWADMLVVGGAGQASHLTKRLERTSSKTLPNARLTLTRQRTNSPERPRSQASKRAGPERSRTIKLATRPTQRRVQLQRKYSATGVAQQTTVVQLQHTEQEDEATAPRNSDPPCQQDGLPEGQPPSNEWSDSTSQQWAIEKIKGIHPEGVTPSQTEVKVVEVDVTLPSSDTSDETMSGRGMSKTDPLPSRVQRERSGTVCRILPTEPPMAVAQTRCD